MNGSARAWKHFSMDELPWRTLLLTAFAVGGFFLLGAVPEGLVFERGAIRHGEYWRLVTGHWVHSDGGHLFWDAGVFLLAGLLLEGRLGNWLLLGVGGGMLAVDAWLWWGDPSLDYYCGLSGVLNALMAQGIWSLYRESRHPVALLTGLAILVKIAFEVHGGQAYLTHTAWPSVPETHAIGFVTGVLLAIFYEWYTGGKPAMP